MDNTPAAPAPIKTEIERPTCRHFVVITVPDPPAHDPADGCNRDCCKPSLPSYRPTPPARLYVRPGKCTVTAFGGPREEAGYWISTSPRGQEGFVTTLQAAVAIAVARLDGDRDYADQVLRFYREPDFMPRDTAALAAILRRQRRLNIAPLREAA